MKTKLNKVSRSGKTKKINKNIITFKNNEYTKLKELGKGLYGTTYLIKNNTSNTTQALKIQKILPEHIKYSTEFQLWRELEFNKNFVKKLNIKDKHFFMEIYDYEIINNCKHIQHTNKFTSTPQNKFDKIMYKYAKSKYCMYYLMELINGITLDELLIDTLKNNKFISNKLTLNLALQYIKCMDLIMQKGYGHNDEHFGNMMITDIPKNNKSFILGNKTIQKCKYQFKLIDYGLLNNKKYTQIKKLQKDQYMFLNKKTDYYYFKTLYVLINFFTNSISSEFIYIDIHKKKHPFETLKYDIYTNLYKNIIIKHNSFYNKVFEKYTKQYPNTKKYLLQLETNVLKSDISKLNLYDFIKNNIQYDNMYEFGLLDIVIFKIHTEFQITYPKLFLEYLGFKIIDSRMLYFPINKNICLQLLEFIKFEEIVNYLTNLYLKQYSI